MTMLTDEKIKELAIKHFGGLSPEITLTGNSQRFARAIESAVREELGKQEPAAYGIFWNSGGKEVLQFPVCATEEEAKSDLQMFSDGDQEAMTIRALCAAPVVQPDMVQKLRDILQMLLQEPDTKAALFKAEDMLREMIAAAQESNANVCGLPHGKESK